MSPLIERLIKDFARLPGIGERTAERLVFHLLRDDRSLVRDFIRDLGQVLDHIRLCSLCQTFTDTDPCGICSDPNRRADLLCIVEEPSTLAAIEKTKHFRGHYYVLHGLLSPLDGIGPEELRISALLERIQREPIEEVIVATNTSVSGDATALYLARLLQPLGLKVTRLSSGVPVGANLEYLDQMTLGRALENRIAL